MNCCLGTPVGSPHCSPQGHRGAPQDRTRRTGFVGEQNTLDGGGTGFLKRLTLMRFGCTSVKLRATLTLRGARKQLSDNVIGARLPVAVGRGTLIICSSEENGTNGRPTPATLVRELHVRRRIEDGPRLRTATPACRGDQHSTLTVDMIMLNSTM